MIKLLLFVNTAVHNSDIIMSLKYSDYTVLCKQEKRFIVKKEKKFPPHPQIDRCVDYNENVIFFLCLPISMFSTIFQQHIKSVRREKI